MDMNTLGLWLGHVKRILFWGKWVFLGPLWDQKGALHADIRKEANQLGFVGVADREGVPQVKREEYCDGEVRFAIA